ncbi:MAG TPA: GntR family transcriptional regulator [Stellaceae bacterium]|nr:GntR family transcriptional regulator [Stellaceae bacterium]
MRAAAKTRQEPAIETPGEVESLADRAYRALEEQIVTLRIPPGAVVSEAALCRRTGFGRTPIREAIQRLARERLILVLPRRGLVVSDISIETQLRLVETRREVERLVARCAARRASLDERTRFAAIGDGMEAAGRENDDTTFMRLDREFNLLSLKAARNEFAAGAMALMHGLSRRFWYIHYKQVADMPRAARLHAAIARAIAAGEPEIAAAASDALMDYIEEFTRATLPER